MALNIVEVSTIEGKGASLALTTTYTNIIGTVNADHLVKVNSLAIANVDGTNSADVSVRVGTTVIAQDIPVPANSTVFIITKDTQINIEPSSTLNAKASASSDLVAYASYEIMS